MFFIVGGEFTSAWGGLEWGRIRLGRVGHGCRLGWGGSTDGEEEGCWVCKNVKILGSK